MQSIVQILKVNEVKKGTSKKTGNPYEMQDAECILLNDDGTVGQVGALDIPKSLMGKVETGTFTASFAMQANWQSRRLEAVLTGLVPVPPGTYGTPKASPVTKQVATAAAA
ncbi:hypothetical protein [Pelomonas cellulosilytica]|uniref:Uncharacterized protein n=1 Tax=Pelomonas cellulosilytica TaxID=2906762 RepID=A0ABS8XVV0_9BURK|nr:hypothetical protein [Pelomonas sp. P8]MCE4555012.1 hypothetical protein [Pelomonas sp. P8]